MIAHRPAPAPAFVSPLHREGCPQALHTAEYKESPRTWRCLPSHTEVLCHPALTRHQRWTAISPSLSVMCHLVLKHPPSSQFQRRSELHAWMTIDHCFDICSPEVLLKTHPVLSQSNHRPFWTLYYSVDDAVNLSLSHLLLHLTL